MQSGPGPSSPAQELQSPFCKADGRSSSRRGLDPGDSQDCPLRTDSLSPLLIHSTGFHHHFPRSWVILGTARGNQPQGRIISSPQTRKLGVQGRATVSPGQGGQGWNPGWQSYGPISQLTAARATGTRRSGLWASISCSVSCVRIPRGAIWCWWDVVSILQMHKLRLGAGDGFAHVCAVRARSALEPGPGRLALSPPLSSCSPCSCLA